MYLTYEEYVTLGGTVSEVDFPQYLRKASGVIDYLTRSFYKQVDLETDAPIRKDGFKAAIVAQMEYFNAVGSTDSYGISAAQSISIGRTSITNKASTGGRTNNLVPQEVNFALTSGGLLFSGVCSV